MARCTGQGDFPIRAGTLRVYGMRRQHTSPAVGSPLGDIVCDYFFGLAGVKVTRIPYLWLTPGLTWRPDLPINDVTAGSTSGASARSYDAASITSYGTYSDRRELDCAVQDDPRNLAKHMVGVYSAPRVRISNIRLTLTPRTELEKHTILDVGIGSRIMITDTPLTWPLGAHKLTVEGVKHTFAADDRIVEWRTSPMLGTITVGEVGPWFQCDVDPLNSTHKLAY